MRRNILQRNRAVAVGYDGYYHGLYSLFAKVETQNFASHEGVYAVIASGLLNGCIGMGWTGDARFCVSTGGICCYCQRFIEWVYWHWLDGRRKILRLYWADAVGLMWWSGARGVLWLRRDV